MMTRGIFISASGMITQQTALDVTANNLANVNTNGFKADGYVFQSVLTSQLGPAAVVPVGGFTDSSSGTIVRTRRPLDVAFTGPGYLAISTPQGIRYTRDGALDIRNGKLTTEDGMEVLGSDDRPITVTGGTPTIGGDGTVAVNNVQVGKLKLMEGASFTKVGSNRYAGTATPSRAASLESGALESSNLSAVHEMVSMIEIMRAYEANQRVLTAQDEAIGRAVNDLARLA